MSKTTVLYRDMAVGADEDAAVSTSGAATFAEPADLPFGSLTNEPVAVLEANSWLLNGTRVLRETQRFAFWSEDLSGEDGTFAAPPTITIDFDEQYSLMGITLVFDTVTEEFCSEINVKWYQGETLKADADFFPNATTYFCSNRVESFDRIVLTLNKTALPYRRAKLSKIVFGLNRVFGMSELRSASVVNEMDGIAETLPISTFKWTLDSKEDVDFMFQLKQPVEIRNDDKLLGVYYIDSHKRKTARIYDIECYDAIGVLDESTFAGGFYTDKSGKELLGEIIGADFEIEYAEDVVDVNLSGILEKASKRSAIQQVLFAWGVCMATDGSKAVKVFNLDTSLTEIGKDQTFTGASIETSSIVTEIRVTAHSYAADDSGSIEIGGAKYSDTETVYTVSNPNVTAVDKQNVKEFNGGTLVSPAIGQSVAQRIYDWYMRRNKAKASIVWKGEALGDYVSFPNSWDGVNAGNITKMEIKLSNTVVAKCESVG